MPWALSAAHQLLQGPLNQQISSMAIIITTACIITIASIVKYSLHQSNCLYHGYNYHLPPWPHPCLRWRELQEYTVSHAVSLGAEHLLPTFPTSLIIFIWVFLINDNLHKNFRARQGQSALVLGEALVRSYTMSIIITMVADHLHQGLRFSAIPACLWEIIQPLAIGVKLTLSPLCLGQPYNCSSMKQRQQAHKGGFTESFWALLFPSLLPAPGVHIWDKESSDPHKLLQGTELLKLREHHR